MNNIFQNLTLQKRTFAAFAFIGAIVLIVALICAIGNFSPSRRLENLADNAYPSTVAFQLKNQQY